VPDNILQVRYAIEPADIQLTDPDDAAGAGPFAGSVAMDESVYEVYQSWLAVLVRHPQWILP
jgi:hypothetical protein